MKSKQKKKRAKQAPLPDGFHWASGYHNGTTLDGRDASMQTQALEVAITRKAIDAALYGKS